MSTKAEFKRIKASLERERLRLKADGLELEKRGRQLTAERDAAIVALRVLTGQYGDPDWPDEMALADVLEHHLARPLAASLAAVSRRLAQLQAEVDRIRDVPRTDGAGFGTSQQAPAPSRDVPRDIPAGGHTVLAVEVDRGQWRARCSCRWQSFGQRNQLEAEAAGAGHVQRMRPERRVP